MRNQHSSFALITIYQKPTCTTCRQVYAALKESGVPLDSVNYYLEPLSKTKLKDLSPEWEVWIQWYEARMGVSNFPAPNPDWELAFLDIPTPLHWEQGYEAVNTEIAFRVARISSHASNANPTSPSPSLIRVEGAHCQAKLSQ